MSDSSRMKNWILIFAIACLFTFANGEVANADGSWGSSRGGWGSGGGSGGSLGGSGGSMGCRGGLFSNAPIRSLLARVGSRVGDGLANLGGGLADIIDRRPLRSALFGGSNGGSVGGSHGGWGSRGSYASTGGNAGWGSNGGWGNAGGSFASTPSLLSDQSYISAPATYGGGSDFISSAPLVDSGSFSGFTNLLDQPIITAESYGSAGSVSAYIDSGFAIGSLPVEPSYMNSVPVSQFETSAPVLDYGYYGSQSGQLGISTDATMMDGAMITGPMLEPTPMGLPVDLDSGGGDIDLSPDTFNLPGGNDSEPTPADAFGADDEDDSAYMPRGKAILSLDVPGDARVYINDKLTKTKGTLRSYVSRNLIRGQEYRYRVKVVSDVDGKEVTKTRVVTMRGGESNDVAFNFDPIVTRVVVNVPDDAKVIIDGKETSTKGSYRSFSTQKLKSGKWDDYSVEVSVVRNGKTLTRKEKFDLAAGEFRFFDFDFDKPSASSVATK